MCDRYSVIVGNDTKEDFNDYGLAEAYFDIMNDGTESIIIYDNIKEQEILRYEKEV